MYLRFATISKPWKRFKSRWFIPGPFKGVPNGSPGPLPRDLQTGHPFFRSRYMFIPSEFFVKTRVASRSCAQHTTPHATSAD